MANTTSKKSVRVYKTTGKILCFIAVAIPCLMLSLRFIDENLLTKISPGKQITQNPLSSICLILNAISLWLVRSKKSSLWMKRTSISIASIVSIIGLAKLILRSNFKIDITLFAHQNFISEKGIWNEMALNTAFCHFLFGLSILFIDRSFLGIKRPSQFLNILILLFSLLTLYGYIYGVEFLSGIFSGVSMSFHTALTFFFLSMAVLFLRPRGGPMAYVIGNNPVQAFLLRFLALLLPLLVGWLRLNGEKQGLYTKEFGTALFAIFTYIISMILIGWKSAIQSKLSKARKKTEKTEKENKRRLHLMLDNNTNAIYVRKTNGSFLFVNKKFEEIFNVKRNELLGKTSDQAFKDKIKEWFNQDDEVLHSGESSNKEETITNEKSSFNLVTYKFPLTDTRDTIYAVCGISTDITKIRNYQKEIIDNEKLLSTIINKINESVFVVNSKGDFLILNQNAKKMIGDLPANYSREELNRVFKFYYADESTPYPLNELPLAKALRGESIDKVELFSIAPGSPKGRRILGTGIPLEKGGEKIALSIYTDITKRRRLQEALHENENRIKAILSTIGEGIIISDVRGKFLLFNKHAEEILGKGPIETKPSQWAEDYNIFYPDGSPFPSEKLSLSRALKGEIVDNLELVIKQPKGNSFITKRILSSGRPITDDDGNVNAAVVNFRDITEFTHIEEVMQELGSKYENLRELLEKKKEK